MMEKFKKSIEPIETGQFLGTVRCIDNLGRVVIPKELRSALDMGIGDAVEILATKTGQIVLQKYEPAVRMGECNK